MNTSTKPRYILKEGKMVMAQEITPAMSKFALPAHLQGKPKVENWGEIDPRQRMLPRIKLLQATNPECADYPGEARPGEFWHTTLTTSLGPEIIGVPIMRRQSYVLWTPRGVPGQDGGILARARDFVHWDPPDGVFHVRFPMNPKTYTWKTARTVRESGLDMFGSSRPDDPKSTPAATLTFEVLWFLPEYNTLALTLNSRGGVQEAKKLFAMVDAKPVSAFNQRYRICALRKPGPSGESYFGYIYRGDGYCDEALSAITEPLFMQWKDVAFATADESEEDEAPLRPASTPQWEAPRTEPHGQAGVVDDDIPF
jgi:hypothetical protein